MKDHYVLESGGLSLLLVLPFIFPLLIPGSAALLHHPLAFANPLAGLLIDFGCFVLLGIAACLITHRLPRFPRSLASGLFVGLILWWAVFSILTLVASLPFISTMIPSTTTEFKPSQILAEAQERVLQLNSLIPMLFVGIAVLKPGFISLLARKVRFALAAFSFCALWIIPEIAYIAFYLHPLSPFDHSNEIAKTDFGKRIIWVLFDELSYKLAIEDTPRGVELPNFHRLALQSFSFGNVTSPGYFTDRIVPAVLMGKEIESIKSNSKGNLLYRESAQDNWHPYDPNFTLFGMARDKGWNPGVAGWYNPYCRVFASVLTSCFWPPTVVQGAFPFEKLGASRSATVFENALVIPRFFLSLFTGLGGSHVIDLLEQNRRDYQILMEQSQKLIQNEQIHFVFIHAPVPHPPGFYDRKRHAFCRCGDYIDNLVLADDTLGIFMQEIEQSPWAQETVLVVSSDHSWRVPFWRAHEGLTPEEAAISKGVYEPRPVFLVHFPGQTTGARIMAPVSELREHDVISSMLHGRVNSSESFNSFLAQKTHAESGTQQTQAQSGR